MRIVTNTGLSIFEFYIECVMVDWKFYFRDGQIWSGFACNLFLAWIDKCYVTYIFVYVLYIHVTCGYFLVGLFGIGAEMAATVKLIYFSF